MKHQSIILIHIESAVFENNSSSLIIFPYHKQIGINPLKMWKK